MQGLNFSLINLNLIGDYLGWILQGNRDEGKPGAHNLVWFWSSNSELIRNVRRNATQEKDDFCKYIGIKEE